MDRGPSGLFAADLRWTVRLLGLAARRSVLGRDGIVRLAVTPAAELIDSLRAGEGDIHALLDPAALLVATYAETAFDAVASVELELWDGLLQVATQQLQQNLGRVFDVETAEPVLRYAFVLRALDEALGLASVPEQR